MPTPAWELRITERDGTLVHSFTSDDTKGNAPIVAAGGQDSKNAIGAMTISIPAEHSANDHFDEDRLLHLFENGDYVTTYIINVPLVGVIDSANEEAGELAVWSLRHLLSIAEEGIVEPAGGPGSQPNSYDRIFDSSDPARDNSDFTTPDELGTVTDAQTNYPVGPYASGIEYPDDVMVIGPAGYGWTDDAPAGRCYFYIDHDFGAGGLYRVNDTGDNADEVRIDGKSLHAFTIGFGTAQTTPKFAISGGVHRVWAMVENGGSVGAEGPCTLALEFVAVDLADNKLGLELGTSSAWGIMEFPAVAPGFTPHEILAVTIAEEQAYGAFYNVWLSSTPTNDSAGTAWPVSSDQTAKVYAGLEQFWVNDLTASLIDIDAHFDFGTNRIYIDAWVKGTHHPSSGLTFTEGVDLAEFAMPHARRLASSLGIVSNEGGLLTYSDESVSAPAGKPVKRRSLSLGSARTAEQRVRDADSQLALFNRARNSPTFVQAVSDGTPFSRLPPNWWKWSQIDLSITSRWISSGTVTLTAVSFQLVDGRFVYIPEAGDLILPSSSLPGRTLRKMAEPSLGGQALVASPTNPIR